MNTSNNTFQFSAKKYKFEEYFLKDILTNIIFCKEKKSFATAQTRQKAASIKSKCNTPFI